MKRIRGFTLVELMICFTAALLLLGVAVPTFTGALEAARGLNTRAALLSSLMLAAQKATITGTHAVLCPSRDGQACRNDADWSDGWLVFLDTDNSREREAGEMLVSAEPAAAGKVRLHTTTGRTRIVFQGNGGNTGSNVTFTLCDGRGPAKARSLVINNQGRLRDAAATPERAKSTCAR